MLEEILKAAAERGASDVHLHVGLVPTARINGDLVPMENFEKLTPARLMEIADEVFRKDQKERFEAGQEIDTSVGVPGVGRFRGSIFRQRGSVGIVLRRVNARIPSFQELCLPPAVEHLTRFTDGLVLVTGVTGSGKSTTLAAMIDRINDTRRAHVLTLEDPIEYLHHDKLSIVTQREIGQDTANFGAALRTALRQDPDVILIGEMRDAETIKAGITAAETGHLVLSTLHTTSAPQTVERILEYFDDVMRPVIRQHLAFHLRGVISQRLVPRLDGGGMYPAVEVMLMNPMVRKLMTQGKTGLLKSVIHNAANEGMQTFDQNLVAIYNAGIASFEECQAQSSNPDAFHLMCQGFFSDIVQGILDV